MEVVERFINVVVLTLAILVTMAAAAVLGMWLMQASSRDQTPRSEEIRNIDHRAVLGRQGR